MGYDQCSVIGCSHSQHPKFRCVLHGFPKHNKKAEESNEAYLKKYLAWVKFTGNEQLLKLDPNHNWRKICSCHFRPDSNIKNFDQILSNITSSYESVQNVSCQTSSQNTSQRLAQNKVDKNLSQKKANYRILLKNTAVPTEPPIQCPNKWEPINDDKINLLEERLNQSIESNSTTLNNESRDQSCITNSNTTEPEVSNIEMPTEIPTVQAVESNESHLIENDQINLISVKHNNIGSAKASVPLQPKSLTINKSTRITANTITATTTVIPSNLQSDAESGHSDIVQNTSLNSVEMEFDKDFQNNKSNMNNTDTQHNTHNNNTQFRKRKRESVATERMTQKKRLELLGLIDVADPDKVICLLNELKCKDSENKLLKKKIASLQNASDKVNKTLESFSDAVTENIDSDVLRDLVMSNVRNKTVEPRGRRWSPKEKIWALRVYKAGPAAYKVWREAMLLPSISTIRRLLIDIPLVVGKNEKLLELMKNQVSKIKDIDRDVAFLLDEMAGKRRLLMMSGSKSVTGFVDYGDDERQPELADHFQVFMIQSLHGNFKQPFEYYFSKGTTPVRELKRLMKRAIISINETGLNVVALICDQGSTNSRSVQDLIEETEADCLREGVAYRGHYIYFEGCRNNIQVIFDPCHLAKTLRNCFSGDWEVWLRSEKKKILMEKKGLEKLEKIDELKLKLEFPGQFVKFKGKVGSWRDFIELYKHVKFDYSLNNGHPKISDNHVFPNSKTKMRVKYATQALSQTNSDLLSAYYCKQHTPYQTSSIFSDFNEIIDYLIGGKPIEGQENSRYVTKNTSHIKKWYQFKTDVKSLSFYKNEDKDGVKKVKNISTPTPDSIGNTFRAMIDLWQFLKKKGHKKLDLRHLNQDALENLFGLIRSHLGDCRSPTCADFEGALKTVMITRFAGKHSSDSNCERDRFEPLIDLYSLVFGVGDSEIEELSIDQRENVVRINVINDAVDLNDKKNIEEENDDDDDDDGIELKVMLNEGLFAEKMMKKVGLINCQSCKENLCSVRNVIDGKITVISDRLSPGCNLYKFINECFNIFKAEIIPLLHLRNILDLAILTITCNTDTTWLSCEAHGSKLLSKICFHTTRYLILEQCGIKNRGVIQEEFEVAARAKVAQQMGKAK